MLNFSLIFQELVNKSCNAKRANKEVETSQQSWFLFLKMNGSESFVQTMIHKVLELGDTFLEEASMLLEPMKNMVQLLSMLNNIQW